MRACERFSGIAAGELERNGGTYLEEVKEELSRARTALDEYLGTRTRPSPDPSAVSGPRGHGAHASVRTGAGDLCCALIKRSIRRISRGPIRSAVSTQSSEISIIS